MVRIAADGEIYLKILLWGMIGSGKTEFIDILHRMTKEEEKDIEPTTNLEKIQMLNGSTLYYEESIFQSTRQRKVFYHVYSVPGQKRFSSLKKKIFGGSDGVIFVVDARSHFLKDNIESLKELINISKGTLIKNIPLVTILNKKDSNNCINKEDLKQILKNEGLWYEPSHKLFSWNPIIYEALISYDQRVEVYHCFSECARRIGLYHILGDGEAPISDTFEK